MDRVEDWCPGFFKRHMARHHREDWPVGEMGRVFFQGWTFALISRHITPHHAERASLEMVDDPPAYLSDHLPRLVKLAREFQRQDEEPPVRASLPAPDEDSLERAEALAQLKALLAPLARSKRAGGRFTRRDPATPPAAIQGASPEPYLADAPTGDRIIDAERAPAPPPQPEEVHIPEDDLGWW